MPKTIITESVLSQYVGEIRDLVESLSQAEQASADLEKKLEDSRQAAQMRRLEIGRALIKARASLPKRGSKDEGWGAFLEAVEIDPSTAWRYMQLADHVATLPEGAPVPTYGELGLVSKEGPQQPDAPPPTDADAPREADDRATSDEPEVDRDTWCTPKWIADALGQVDLDPCSNERSHIQAKVKFDLANDVDGLANAAGIGKSWRVFVNPPYSDVRPWIDAYAHTRFVFLLKFDPSTKWFARLMELTETVLIPKGTRVAFEPPPGVDGIANPFPHALFFAKAEDVPPELLERCFPQWRIESAA